MKILIDNGHGQETAGKRSPDGRGDKWYNAEGWCCYTSPGQTAGDLLANHLCQAALQNLPGHRMRFDYTDGDADQEAAFFILRHTACAAALTENGFRTATGPATSC